MTPSHPFDLLIGLDRSDRKADLCYIEPATGRRWRQTLDTAPERLHDWPKSSPKRRSVGNSEDRLPSGGGSWKSTSEILAQTV